MKEELYIDDQIVDLYPDKPITLNFKSNILHDISKITASNSYTIQLPKTTRNRCVLDNPTAPAYDSRFRYRTHAARYLRNGMIVIDSATAIVMESSESYEIALTWGVLQALKTWVSDAPKLSDLPDEGTTLAWDENTVPDSYPPAAGAFFADYNTGVPMLSEAKKFGNIHPSGSLGFWSRSNKPTGLRSIFRRRKKKRLKNWRFHCLKPTVTSRVGMRKATNLPTAIREGLPGFPEIHGMRFSRQHTHKARRFGPIPISTQGAAVESGFTCQDRC